MAKKFTDSEKWKRPWWNGLNLKMKVSWIYLLDQCDHRGVWPFDLNALSKGIDMVVTKEEFFEAFASKVVFLEDDEIFIPSFWKFQYKGSLNKDNNCHKGVLALFEKYPGLREWRPTRESKALASGFRPPESLVFKPVITIEHHDAAFSPSLAPHQPLVRTSGGPSQGLESPSPAPSQDLVRGRPRAKEEEEEEEEEREGDKDLVMDRETETEREREEEGSSRIQKADNWRVCIERAIKNSGVDL